nr:hypothetical protein CFP56_12995 [Quercus suber]
MERAVRRSELRSPRSTPPSSPGVTTLEHVRPSREFVYIDYDAPTTDAPLAEEEALDYLLFAPDPLNRQTTQKITIRTPTPQISDSGFVVPSRPDGFYFTSGKSSIQFQQAAITAEQIHAQSRVPWSGSSYPWRVMHVPLAAVTKAARAIGSNTCGAERCSTSKRRRQGKKGRIRERCRREAERQQYEKVRRPAQASGMAAGEGQTSRPLSEAARLEKSARNREKKLKRRAREKIKKAEMTAGLMAETNPELEGKALTSDLISPLVAKLLMVRGRWPSGRGAVQEAHLSDDLDGGVDLLPGRMFVAVLVYRTAFSFGTPIFDRSREGSTKPRSLSHGTPPCTEPPVLVHTQVLLGEPVTWRVFVQWTDSSALGRRV